MRLALTSDIHIDINGSATLEALAARVREVRPDALLIAGDIATSPTVWLETLTALRAHVPHLLVVAGNHDVWTTPAAAAAGLDSRARLERLLPALCAEAGAALLDQGPVVIGDVGFAGCMGWFDYSTREHLLDAPMDAYTKGEWSGLRWMDHKMTIWPGPDGQPMDATAVAAWQQEQLTARLQAVPVSKIVAVTHFLAFEEQIHRKEHPGWRFVNAFMGCLGLGRIVRADPRVVLAVAGHTHLGSDLRIGRLRALVSPLGYRREWLGTTPAEAVRRAVAVVDV